MTKYAAARLSAGAEELARRLDAGLGGDADCDVLVIGSGYGGSVAAARFAGRQVTTPEGRRPARVWLVERGREYLPGMFPDHFSELPGHVRFARQDGAAPRGDAEGLFDLRLGDDATLLLGNGLGGGSLINAGVLVEPDASVFATGWPAGLDRDALKRGYEAARRQLAPEAARPMAKTEVLRTAAQRVGARFQLAEVAVRFESSAHGGGPLNACTQCGDCMTGCNQGAKKSLDTNYLETAVSRGAELFCGVAVERVEPPAADGLPWTVLWHFTAPSLRPPGGVPMRLRAQRVVIAAGALGSTEILLRSRSPRLPLSHRLGQRFSINGDAIAAVHRHRVEPNCAPDQETDPAVDGRRVGPTITGLVRAQIESVPIVVEEFAVPGALSRVFGEVVAIFRSENNRDDADAPEEDPLAATGTVIRRSGLYGLMGDDGAAGTLVLPAAAPGARAAVEGGVRVDWPKLSERPLFKSQLAWLRSATNAASDGTVVENPLVSPWGLNLGGPAVSVHPLGGCPMADDALDGVVDPIGRVFRDGAQVHVGLVVLDGAIVPRALGINPALTIAALAEQAAAALAPAWGLGEADASPRALPPRLRWAPRRNVPRQPTEVELKERLGGFVTVDGVRWRAVLDVNFATLQDLSGLLEARKREVDARSRLALWRADPHDDEFTPAPDRAPERRLDLAGTVILFGRDDNECPELRYEFKVTDDASGDGWPAGRAVTGLKVLFASGDGRGLWRQLSEMTLTVAGSHEAKAGDSNGRLALDFGDLAERRQALLAVLRQSSAPDALADLAALPLYVLRLLANGQFDALRRRTPAVKQSDEGVTQAEVDRVCQVLQCRQSAAVEGVEPETRSLGEHGARLHRYRRENASGSKARPVLLVHGLGAGGSTFTLPALPKSLCGHLLDAGREVWVIDLRTSIANEPADPGAARPGPWSIEDVAGADIPAALEAIQQATGQRIDVVAHCIGAAMFCIAALSDASVRPRVGAVVLSQVAPRLRLSPLNRLRGYVASYLEQFIGVAEFDTRPEYQRVRDPATGQVRWRRDEARARAMVLTDLLLSTFPYPDNDGGDGRQQGMRVDFSTVRHRADAIFGQLMELKKLDDATLAHLEAIYGWVKVRTLAQTIHYARLGLLANAEGRNQWLLQERLAQGMDFPLLLLHGRRNRVFDWRGSQAAYRLMCRVRGQAVGTAQRDGAANLWGAGTALRLRVLDDYGHQDCMIGSSAAADVFAPLTAFLDEHAEDGADAQRLQAPTLEVSFDRPGVGPMLGAVRPVAGGSALAVRVLIHPSTRRARACGIVVVPRMGDASVERRALAARALSIGAGAGSGASFGAGAELAADDTAMLLSAAQELVFDALYLRFGSDEFDVFVAHSDVNSPQDLFEDEHGPDPKTELGDQKSWLEHGRRLVAQARQALQAALAALEAREASAGSAPNLRLKPPVRDAALQPLASALGPAPLAFALASCQYPHGLFDRDCAEASLRALEGACSETPSPGFLLAVGDQVYVDATAGVFEPAQDATPAAAVDAAYRRLWDLQALGRVASRLPVLPMLDDHEVADNWQPGHPSVSDAMAQVALQRFGRWQGTLLGDPPGGGRRWRALRSAGALFVLLDTRTGREQRRVSVDMPGVDLEQASIVPPHDLDAVLDLMAGADPKVAKFLVSPSPLLPLERFHPQRPMERMRSDTWAGYPASCARLLDGLADRKVPRVVLLAGDAHASMVCRLRREGAPAVHAVVSSGLFAAWPFANSRLEEFQTDGPVTLPDKAMARGVIERLAASERNGFATLSLEGPEGDPHARLCVTLRASDGTNTVSRIEFERG